jgi:prepilin-type N-terminal cleavage/methylation domain-containing protein
MLKSRPTPGFTLVEMLVAIALLGLLGVISWRGLDYVSAQRIVYRVADAALTRSASPAAAELPVATASNAVHVLPGARGLSVRAYSGGFWTEPGTGAARLQPPARATAIEVTVVAADGARYVRVFVL